MEAQRVLRMEEISKSFPGVKALDAVNLDLDKGEVLGLLGENGAGKSTLIKILAGTYSMDSGRIFLEGKRADMTDPGVAKRLGIRVIYQELNTLDHLSVAENIFLGDLARTRLGLVDWNRMLSESREVLRSLAVELDPRVLVGKLSTGQKQIVEIARAISKKSRIIVMDEPTAALGEKEEEVLFSIIRSLKKQGIAIIYISHKLSEIFTVTDRVTVLRDGKLVGTRVTAETNRNELVKMMVGRDLTEMYPKVQVPIGEVVMEVRGFSAGKDFQDISFSVRSGEIVGLFGLEGSGRTPLIRSLFGAQPKDAGELLIRGRKVGVAHPGQAKSLGLGLIPISRKEEGVTLSMSVANNIVMTTIERLGSGVLLDRGEERRRAEKWTGSLTIRTPSLDTELDNLSGGNQQKVVIAKWLESGAKIFLMNEPTRGIDVGAKVEIYKLMERLCEEGNAVIMSSTELPEVLSIPDRILVMARGRLTAEFAREEADKEKLIHAASM
jgi:ribose transport system ATP-binding protein